MTGYKGLVGDESGMKSLQTDRMLAKPIHSSEAKENGILTVGVQYEDLGTNVKSEGNSLTTYLSLKKKMLGSEVKLIT